MQNRSSLLMGVLAAIGATSCCAGPLVLLMLGVSGAWIGNLSALEPYRPIFILISMGFLGYVFYQLYIRPPVCEIGSCEADSLKRNRRWFWLISVIAILLIAFPWYGMVFFE